MQTNTRLLQVAVTRLFRFFARKLTLAGAAAFIALVIFARFSAEFSENGKLRLIDESTLAFFGAHRLPVLFSAMRAVTWAAGSKPQAVLVALSILVLIASKKFWPQAATVFMASAGGMGAVIMLKWLFHRPRPELIFAPLGYSFPSGHSFFAVVLYGTYADLLAHHFPKQRRVIWGVWAFSVLLVGFSRIYLGEHYPSDVGAGYAAGIFWLWFSLSLPRIVAYFRPASG